jgi:hypothetical protein
MAPSFGCTSLSKKRERGEERRPNEESRAVNTGAKMDRFVGAAKHLCWQNNCRVIASFSSRKSRSNYPYKLGPSLDVAGKTPKVSACLFDN